MPFGMVSVPAASLARRSSFNRVVFASTACLWRWLAERSASFRGSGLCVCLNSVSAIARVFECVMSEAPLRDKSPAIRDFENFLAQVGQIVILGEPAVLDTIEANAPLDGPIAACFARPGGAQDIDLRIGGCLQVCPLWEVVTATRPRLPSINLILGLDVSL